MPFDPEDLRGLGSTLVAALRKSDRRSRSRKIFYSRPSRRLLLTRLGIRGASPGEKHISPS